MDDDRRRQCKTSDTFIGCLPTGDDRVILIFRRQHKGKSFVRWRTWHCHKMLRRWYPDSRRHYLVPLEHAQSLAEGILAAVQGEAITKPPKWFDNAEERRAQHIHCLRELNAPAPLVKRLEKNAQVAIGESTPKRRRAIGEGPKRRHPKQLK